MLTNDSVPSSSTSSPLSPSNPCASDIGPVTGLLLSGTPTLTPILFRFALILGDFLQRLDLASYSEENVLRNKPSPTTRNDPEMKCFLKRDTRRNKGRNKKDNLQLQEELRNGKKINNSNKNKLI
ncbi:MAG: hypothetical protein AB7F53_06795 [Nitrososphaeraceae archaeon]